jgi:hypothetical protein
MTSFQPHLSLLPEARLMKISEIETIKSKTPAQLRIDALKKAADQASSAVSAERQRKRLNKARAAMAKINQA